MKPGDINTVRLGEKERKKNPSPTPRVTTLKIVLTAGMIKRVLCSTTAPSEEGGSSQVQDWCGGWVWKFGRVKYSGS